MLGRNMNCIVTAGPAYEPLDDVRRLTNFSTGRLGTTLANYLAARGHSVILLLGEQATYAGERRAQRVESFSTAADLRAKLKTLAAKKVDAIFHADAAGEVARRIAAHAENHRGVARLVSADKNRRLEIRGGWQARGSHRRGAGRLPSVRRICAW
jgi:phosphopantothenoylcysteine synthetase/decarboxylase